VPDPSRPDEAPAPPLPVPVEINRALVVVVSAALWGLLVLASRLEPSLWQIVVAAAFAVLFQTNFALLHEATHGVLSTSRRENHVLGFLCGVIFPLSITLLTVAHQSHHDKNRGPEERFDVVDTQASLPKRRLVWTLGLLGAWYLSIPVWCAGLLVAPDAVRAFSERSRVGDRIFAQPHLVRRARLELVAVVAVHLAAFWGLDLTLRGALVCYGAAAFWWSSIQYLQHAFAPLERVEGAFNLRAPRWYSWLVLHYQLHLTHHRQPWVSWVHLPRLSARVDDGPDYAAQWWRLWSGPVLLSSLPGSSSSSSSPADPAP
jgi:fatty acid desaturase